MKKFISNTALIVLSLASSQSNAVSFHAMDPRSVGMGGIGVATGNSSQAHYFNPALLVSAPEKEDFNFEVDAAVRATDSDGLFDGINDFSDRKILQNFTQDITALVNTINTVGNNGLSRADVDAIISDRDALVTSSNNLLDGIHSVTNKSVTLHTSAGISASNPEANYGWTLFANVHVPIAAQGNLDQADDKLLSDYIDVLDVQLNRDDLIATTQKVQTLLVDLQTKNPQDLLQSDVSVYGAVIKEIGFSYASRTSMSSYAFDYGLTPKMLIVDAYDRTIPLNLLKANETLERNNTVKSYKSFDIDLGIAKKLSENWKSGLAISNVLKKEFKTPNGEKIRIDPAARIGIGYRNNWLSIGADLDLTENRSMAGYDKSRFAAAGAEIDVWLLQLRAGYRMNLSNDVSYPSLGLGLYLFGIDIDASVAGKLSDIRKIKRSNTTEEFLDAVSGIDDVGMSLRLGVSW